MGSAPPAGGSWFTMMEFMPGNAMLGLHRTALDEVCCLDHLPACRPVWPENVQTDEGNN